MCCHGSTADLRPNPICSGSWQRTKISPSFQVSVRVFFLSAIFWGKRGDFVIRYLGGFEEATHYEYGKHLSYVTVMRTIKKVSQS